MKLTKKILILILSICVVFSLLYLILFHLVLTKPIDEQKALLVRKTVANVLSIFDNERDRIRLFTSEWASRDCMYEFASSRRLIFKQEISPCLTVKDGDISLFLLLDRNREIVNISGFHNSHQMAISFSPLGERRGNIWNYVKSIPIEQGVTFAIVKSEYGPLLLVSSPVYKSSGKGPSAGRLVMGRLIDKSLEKKFSSLLREDIALLPYPGPLKSSLEKIDQLDDRPIWVEKKGSLMDIYFPILDVNLNPVMTIRVTAHLEVFKILEQAIGLFFLLLIVGFLLSGVLFYLIIHQLVVKRIKSISEMTNKIVSFNDLSLEIPASTPDEIGLLSRNINCMLKRLQEENMKREEIERMLLMNEKMVFLGRVITDISHEVNNPLFAIAFSFQLLKKYLPSENERVAEAAQVLENEIDRVRGITRNMHRFTIQDIESASLSDLVVIMELAIKVSRWSKKIKDTEIVFNKQARSFPLYCNPGSLQQVFMNIIINAVDATKGKGKLVIDIQEVDGEYKIDFIDNGPGVSEQYKRVLFQPFKSTKGNYGTGLGLNISQHIVSNHGGTITLDESYAQGAHFIIRIPRKGGINHDEKASYPGR